MHTPTPEFGKIGHSCSIQKAARTDRSRVFHDEEKLVGKRAWDQGGNEGGIGYLAMAVELF